MSLLDAATADCDSCRQPTIIVNVKARNLAVFTKVISVDWVLLRADLLALIET